MTLQAAPPTYARTVSRAFELFQTVVNTDPDELKEARRRRDLFDDAFCGQPDVKEVFCSGSLRRKTHKDPIHDVDNVVVYNTGSRPSWGTPGPSAKAALDEVAGTVDRLLGVDGGTIAQEVTLAHPRNHAVRCSFGELRGHGFTVDVMPALRVEGGLLVPVARDDRWEVVDPEYLIRQTERRQQAWDEYVETVRVLKYWKDERKRANPLLDAKSLLIEVLAYEILTTAQTKPVALESFFTAAAIRMRRQQPVQDPAHKCGPIQQDVNVEALVEELTVAAVFARRANLAEAGGDDDGAIDQWRNVFGTAFPSPRPSPALHGLAAVAVPAQAAAAAERPARKLRDEPQG